MFFQKIKGRLKNFQAAYLQCVNRHNVPDFTKLKNPLFPEFPLDNPVKKRKLRRYRPQAPQRGNYNIPIIIEENNSIFFKRGYM